jgi:hypothetical protein
MVDPTPEQFAKTAASRANGKRGGRPPKALAGKL